MNIATRQAYWQTLAESHIYIQHGADMGNGQTRRSFLIDVEEEISASEFNKLDLPCVAVGAITGKVILKDGARKNRYQNRLLFLAKFSVVSDADPSIPASKEAASELTFEIMNDFIDKVQTDYEADQCTGEFRYIDENTYQWEAVDMMADNLCGWALYFNDEENRHFDVDPAKWQ